MLLTPNLSLIAWNLSSDPYNSEELSSNWVALDQHDHTEGKGVSIPTAGIQDQAITAAKLHPTAIPAFTIGTNTITTAMLQADSVTAAKIATDAVGASEIASGAVGTGELGSSAVTRSKTAGDFIQAKRVSFSSEAGPKTVTWTTPFADANYTITTAWASTVPTASLARLSSQIAASVVVNMSSSVTGTLHLIAIHD